MRKKFLFYILSVFILAAISLPEAQAAKNSTESYKQYKARAEKEIRNILIKQVELSDKKDLEKLQSYYSDDYRNSDAFDKNTTFALVRDNFEIYPDLKISLKINNVDVNGKYAVADVLEYAKKNGLERDDIDYKGKLRAEARTLYFLENINGKWLITAEQSIYENNSVTFGEAEYADVKLITPIIVPAGSQYNAELKINNLPQSALVMGSISKSDAVYPIPQEEDDPDSYRVFEETSLERLFTANKDNIDEYISGTLGITRSKPLPNGDFKLYMSGVAFVMAKVNVIPENTKYIPEKNIVTVVNKQIKKEEKSQIEPDDILPNDDFVKESEKIDD
ncbi:hypothetical protein J6S88_02405 [bacterium]|nr:hypothetical protein [bacterium]